MQGLNSVIFIFYQTICTSNHFYRLKEFAIKSSNCEMLIFLDYDYLRNQSIFFVSCKILPLHNFTALNVPEDQWICHWLKAIKSWRGQLLSHSASPELPQQTRLTVPSHSLTRCGLEGLCELFRTKYTFSCLFSLYFKLHAVIFIFIRAYVHKIKSK